MNKRVLLTATLLAVTLATPSRAEDRACLIEGALSIMGQTIEIKDCLQNDGATKQQFLQSCQGIADSAASMGAPPSKVSYMASCPAAAKASCKGLFGGALSGFYYARDTETLEATKTSCEAGGGVWHVH